MADLILTGLRRNARLVTTPLALGGAWLRVLPRDPQRYLISFPSDPVNQVAWLLGDASPTASVMTLQPNGATVTISEDVHGGIVTYPMWMASSPGATTIAVMTASYQPEELAIYQGLIHEFVSQRKSPGAY